VKSIGKIFSAIMCACVMLLTYGSIFASAMGLEKRYEIKKSLPEYLADEIDLSSVKDIKESGSNNEITLSLNDGTYTTYTYSENVWYESSSGIKFKDTAIEKQDNKALEKEGYAYTVADNDDSADFSTDSSKGIRVTNNGVTFTLAPISTATGKSNGKIVKADGSDTFVYEDAYGAGTDLAFVPQLNGIKEEIILSEYNGCNSYKFNLEVNSGTPVIKDGCLCFKDNTTGAVVSKTELPYAYDSKGNQTSDCSYTLCKSGKDKYILTLSVSDQWLKSKKTVYPVVIDPTSVNAETQYDTTVYTSKMFNKNSSCGANDNEVGYRGLTYGYARSLVSVDIPSSVTKGSIINSAKYYAKQTNSKSSNKYIDVYALTSSWNEDTVYGGAPSYDSTKISQRLVNKSNNSGTADSTWFDFDITGAVSDWVNGRKTNYGVMLKYSSESFSLFSDYRVFASKENSSAANKPYTVINYTPDTTSPVYTSVTGAPDGWTNKNVALTVNGASDSGAGLAATAYSFSTARGIYNWQSSNVSESFSGSGTIYVYVRDAADNITYCGSYDLKIDKDAPTVEKVIGNPETWTYKDVTLKVEGISDGNGEGAAELPYSFSTAKGTYNWQASNKKTFKNNQTVYIYTRDKQGNIALVDTEVIGKISNTAPAVTAGTVTSSKISVSWSAINGAQSYELVCNGKIYSGITGTNYTFSGLTAGKTYEIEARAVGENGKGPWSDKISVTASAGTVVTTDYIRSDTEWKKENGPYYINGDLSIEDGVTLTIDEGVTVIVSPVTGSAGRIGIEGTLNIKGTSDEPVIFKSKNGENTSSWNGMIVFSSGTLNIDNAEIYDVRNPDTANDTQTDFNAYNAIINYNNDTTKSGNITVKNTKFRDCDTAVSCSGNMNSIIDIENCDIAARYDGIDIINTSTCDINVKNNKISAEKLIGLTLYYVAGKDMTVTGNIIKNCGEYSIYMNLLSSGSNILGFDTNKWDGKAAITGYLPTMTFAAGEYVLDGDVKINSGKTVTLDSGARIRCLDNCKINVSGTLQSNGTAENRVKIVGNNNDWDAIIVQKDGSFNAKYTDIRGAGNNNTVYTYGDLQLDHCRLTGGGTGVAANNKSGKLIIRNSKIACTDDDAKPLYLNVHDAEYVDISENTLTAGKKADKAVIFESVPDISCKFSDNTVMGAANYSLYLNLNSFNATAFTGFDTNTFENKVYLGTYTNINVDMSLPKATYQVNGMFVNEGKTLTLAPGTVILFDVAKADHPTYFHIAGTLNAKGTDDDPIIFTSVADPTYSDQSTEGYWGALWGMQTGTMNLSHVNFKYCGAGSAANGTTYGVNDVPALKVSGKCNADHLTFMHIYGTAICLYSGTTASSFEYTSFIDIGKYNAVNNTDISKFALYNQTSNSLDMKYCYWGTSSGRPSLYVPQVDGNGNIYYVWTNEGYKLYSPQGDVDWANTGLAEPVNSGNAYSLADLRKSVPQGSFVRQYTDLSMTNNAGSLDITRIYKSLASKNDSGLGYGWSLLGAGSIRQYSLKVVDIYGNISEQNVPGKYAAVLPDGNTYIITKNDNGTYTCNDGRFKVTCDSTYGYFTLTSNDKTVYSFDTAGRLTSVTERSGYQKKYYYGTTGCITSYTDSSGRNYSFTYEGTHIKTITDAQGRSVTYGYSGNYLTSVTDALGNITKYTYDTAGNLTSITDGNGSVLEQATYFDSYMNTHGRLNSTTDANGKTTYYTYLDSRNELITCTSAGQYTYIWYDDNGNVIKTQYPDETTESTVYDASDNYGEASSVTDKYGVVTSCEKDSDGNIIKTVYSDGTTVVNTYDAYNNLTSTKDRAGVYTFYVYDANGKYQLKKAVAMNGQTTYNGTADSGYRVTSTEYYDISVYNIPGLIKSVTDPSGNKITYTYDQYGNTTSMTDANGSKSSFTYDICGRLLKTVTPGGYVITNTYDADGNLTATKYNDGRTYTYTYDKAGNKLSETSPSGSCTAYTYYANSKVKTQTDALGNVTSYTYDANGNVETKTDAAGNIYRYVYDDMGRVTEEYLTDVSIGYELPVCSYIYNTCSGYYTVETRIFTDNVNYRSTLRYYDSNDRNYKTVNADGSTTQTVYNADGTAGSVKAANGAVIYYEYNADKKVTAQWSSLSDNTYSYIGYTYDASGNVLTETAGKTATALKTVPSDTYTTVYTYDGVGNKLSETQQNGKKTEYVYDAEGNVATLREYTGTSSFNKTDYSYDCMGKVTKVTQYLTKGDIAGNSVSDTTVVPVTVQYTYDSDENVVSQTDPDGTVTSNTYDKCGRLLSSTKGGASVSQTYDKVGNTATYTDALGNKTSYSYNAAGKVLKSTDALGGTTYNKYNLSGDLILTVSPENYKENTADFALSRTEYNYDNMGRETSCIQTYYDNAEKQWVSFTQYSSVYDAGGNTIAQTDALGNTSSYTYDLSGNASSYTDALGNKYLFTYDALGRKISQTDPDGTVTSFEYDGNGKTVRQTVSAGGKTMTVSAAYDLLGNQLSATDANGNTTAYTYNGLGNIKSCTLPGDVSVSALTTAYQYDMAGNTACVSDTSGKSIKMNYDANGHVTKQTESSVSGSDSISISYTYDKNGNVLTSTDANGNTTSYTYDALGRQTSSTLAGKTQYAAYNKNGDQISSTDIYGNISTCTYDALGRKTAVTDGSGVTVETLTYDNDSRQITSTDALGNTVTYGYDAMGNIISTTDPLGDVTESRYDFRGNVISSEDAMFNVTTYSYNGFNELVSVTDADGEVTSYTYDSNGNMTAYKDAAGRGDTYTYNCRNMVSTETDGNGHVQKFAYTPSGNISTQTMKDGTRS
jgi:YD repeat-containing protein